MQCTLPIFKNHSKFLLSFHQEAFYHYLLHPFRFTGGVRIWPPSSNLLLKVDCGLYLTLNFFLLQKSPLLPFIKNPRTNWDFVNLFLSFKTYLENQSNVFPVSTTRNPLSFCENFPLARTFYRRLITAEPKKLSAKS